MRLPSAAKRSTKANVRSTLMSRVPIGSLAQSARPVIAAHKTTMSGRSGNVHAPDQPPSREICHPCGPMGGGWCPNHPPPGPPTRGAGHGQMYCRRRRSGRAAPRCPSATPSHADILLTAPEPSLEAGERSRRLENEAIRIDHGKEITHRLRGTRRYPGDDFVQFPHFLDYRRDLAWRRAGSQHRDFPHHFRGKLHEGLVVGIGARLGEATIIEEIVKIGHVVGHGRPVRTAVGLPEILIPTPFLKEMR